MQKTVEFINDCFVEVFYMKDVTSTISSYKAAPIVEKN